jgi:hypothetical protein
MPVLISTEVSGQTPENYDRMLVVLGPQIRQSDGFVFHAAFPVDGGWRVIEVWDSKAQANQFFAKNVVPNLPPGIHPKRTLHELHSLLTP